MKQKNLAPLKFLRMVIFCKWRKGLQQMGGTTRVNPHLFATDGLVFAIRTLLKIGA